MILANGCNITKSEKCKGVWILSVPTVYGPIFGIFQISALANTFFCLAVFDTGLLFWQGARHPVQKIIITIAFILLVIEKQTLYFLLP